MMQSLSAYNDGFDRCWWVALSGGLDSTVLLHSLVSVNWPIRIAAIYVNHQLSPNADAWQAHCEHLCRALGVPFFTQKVDVQKQGRGLEDAARQARYAVFASLMQEQDFLLTAHHADDQAETLMLRLLRGTGVKGLSGIAAEKKLQTGKALRPLLSTTRRQLEEYARFHQLTWVTDESNFSDAYDRNYLRNQVMPLLQERWPNFQLRWQQTAQLCADNNELINQLAATDLEQVDCQVARVGQSIDRELLIQLSTTRQRNLLRYWLEKNGYDLPEHQHWQQIYVQLFSENSDTQAQVQFGNLSLRLYQQRIYALPNVLPFMQLQKETAIATEADCLLRADLPNLHIRYRQGGERCRPATRAHSQTLKKLLQEYHLEPWLRDQVPLIFSGDVLVAVADLFVCAGYQAATGEEGVLYKWQ